MKRAPVLEIKDLTVDFGLVRAISELSFSAYAGEVLCIVGESGSGKSVTALSIMRLLEHSSDGRITGGEIVFHNDATPVDIRRASETTMRSLRGNKFGMIFQDPLSCLNPLFTIADQVGEVLRVHKNMDRKAATRKVVELAEMLRIPDAERRVNQYPHQLSGGMRQRIMIAMALACEPKIFIADEPTTALDVTVQRQILALILEIKERLNTAILFITHDLGVVAEIADRVLVMRKSRFIEEGTVEQIFTNPKHPYTRELIRAVPRLGDMRNHQKPQPFDLSEVA